MDVEEEAAEEDYIRDCERGISDGKIFVEATYDFEGRELEQGQLRRK